MQLMNHSHTMQLCDTEYATQKKSLKRLARDLGKRQQQQQQQQWSGK